MPSKRKIVAYQGERGACRAYRLLFPLNELQKHHDDDYHTVITDGIVNPHDYQTFDLMIFQRSYKEEIYREARIAKDHGVKIVYELDDNVFTVPRWNPAYAVYSQERVRAVIAKFMRMADALFVSTQPLADYLSKYNPNIYVLPNSIEFEEALKPRPNNNRLPVVGYQGSYSHQGDFPLAEPDLARVAASGAAVVKLFYGRMPGAISVNYVPYEHFYTVLAQCDFDVALAPLVKNLFNASKSNLKFLEAAASRTVVLASDVYPYTTSIEDGVTGVIVKTGDSWYSKLMALTEDASRRERIADAAYAHVLANYNIANNYRLWKSAIESVLDAKQQAIADPLTVIA